MTNIQRKNDTRKNAAPNVFRKVDTGHPYNAPAKASALYDSEVYQEEIKRKGSSCEDMQPLKDGLFLMELKVQGKNWIPQAKNQLENTVRLITGKPPSFPFSIPKGIPL